MLCTHVCVFNRRGYRRLCTSTENHPSQEALRKSINNRNYYLKYKERLNANKMKYYKENKERVAHTMKEYQAKNKEKLSKKANKYYEENKADFSRRSKEYNAREKQLMKEEVKENVASIRKEFETLFGILTPSDWYKITYKERIRFPSSKRVFQKLPLIEFLEIAYPEETWLHGNFKRTPKNTWTEPKKLREFLESIEPALFIKEPEDWYRVSLNQLRSVGATGIVTSFRRLHEILSTAFPEREWDCHKFSYTGKKSTQRWLLEVVKKIYHDQDTIVENYDHPDLHWDEKRKRNMELDIWVPHLSLAFEYQGEQHYHNLASIFGTQHSLVSYKDRDTLKHEACKREGITLIPVPYWWDGGENSLLDIIEQYKDANS
eukprot:TRINITY_DN13224_c0_g1_i1.p1 TRINITY_DN13224_c0_g1~~TRINITY_DN13224_c0_g1_i1.p1  ORF type:complete len:376 (-),score=85.71 TRINITY_DN13224_c0_g1_i1:90-1217(-)